MSLIQFLSAFGLGAIVVALVQAWFSHRAYISKRNFEEKKESYIGFIDGIYKTDLEQNEETGSYLAHWFNRIELVGSPDVIDSCRRFKETDPVNDKVHPDRPQVFRDLKNAMRKDLGVTK
jgi:hypothetical protein